METTAAGEGEKLCSVVRMEDDGGGHGQKLIECLRGRLFAERQASRAAEEDADLLGKRLMELENRLREEIKRRDRAEKKLTILKKKLESLNSSRTLKEQEELFDNSDTSSTTTISGNSDQTPSFREDSIMEKNNEKDVKLAFSVSFTTSSDSKTEERKIIRQGVNKEIQNSVEEQHMTRANQCQTLIW